jgi:hypothetical protein
MPLPFASQLGGSHPFELRVKDFDQLRASGAVTLPEGSHKGADVLNRILGHDNRI